MEGAAGQAKNKIIPPREMQLRMQRFIDASQELINAMAKLHIHSIPMWSLNPETGEFKRIIDEKMEDLDKKYQEIIALLHKRIVIDGE